MDIKWLLFRCVFLSVFIALHFKLLSVLWSFRLVLYVVQDGRFLRFNFFVVAFFVLFCLSNAAKLFHPSFFFILFKQILTSEHKCRCGRLFESPSIKNNEQHRIETSTELSLYRGWENDGVCVCVCVGTMEHCYASIENNQTEKDNHRNSVRVEKASVPRPY